MFCPRALAETSGDCFFSFLSCKSWFIILIIVFTNVFEGFPIDFCFGGFSLATGVFTLERFETVSTFIAYLFGVLFPCRGNN